MRRNRFLHAGLATLSALICAAVAGAWPRSYFTDTTFSVTTRSISVCVRFVRGHVGLGLSHPEDGFSETDVGFGLSSYSYPGMGSDLEYLISDNPDGHKWTLGGLGFYFARESISGGADWWIVLPGWFVTLLAGIVSIGVARRRRPKSRATGRCSKCSYDLTGNQSGICPECGTPLPRQSANDDNSEAKS